MARDTHISAIGYVAMMTGENVELLEQIAVNSENVDYGEIIDVATGPDEGITAFTSHGIDSLKEFTADVRTWEDGIRQFLLDDGRNPEMTELIMTNEPR